ncbi:MAG: transcription elongation factor GreB [Bdellovibrionota bacterium]
MAKTYLSPAAFEAMKAELRTLLDDERPRVVAQVSAAAALGDRSENAEYIYGKKRLREIDRRVRFLQQRLADVEVISSEQASSVEARFGSWVKVENDDGVVKTFQIIGPDEMDSSGRKITFTSPLGKAILGKKVGDAVEIQSPKGKITYEILEISNLEISD